MTKSNRFNDPAQPPDNRPQQSGGSGNETNTLKIMGYSADDIANVVKNTFHGDAVTAARTLKNAGYSAEEIANAVKTTWNCGIDEVSQTLTAAGYADKEVAASIRTVYNGEA